MTTIRRLALVMVVLAGVPGAYAAGEAGSRANQKTEVGAWFGSATPELCNVPAEFGGGPALIVMMPQIQGDGTMVATDSGSLGDHHLMGQGNWTKQSGNDGIQATFMWLQPAAGPAPAGVFRVRLTGRLDSGDSDKMQGAIEPFFFPFAADGLPNPDPVAGPLPECTGLNGCLGRFVFVVRRIPTE